MLQKVTILAIFLPLIAIFIIVNNTSPASIHPIGLLVFFIAVYMVVVASAIFLARLGYFFMQSLSKKMISSWSWARAYEYASAFALAPIILLAMRTVGEVQLIDWVFVIVFTLLLVFYIAKRA